MDVSLVLFSLLAVAAVVVAAMVVFWGKRVLILPSFGKSFPELVQVRTSLFLELRSNNTL